MPFVAHLALVSESASVELPELTRVGAALQKQVLTDLNHYWQVQGTVNAFAKLEDVPPGYWPIIVKDDISQDAAGVHCDDTGQPMALIVADVDWSVTASHEILEILIDPSGDFRMAGPSVHPDQGPVEYLVEVADPVADKWYQVNGVKVSDFYTRRYFDPVKADGVQYSFLGDIKAPRTILSGGYLTWFEPAAGEWWQQSWFTGDQPSIRSLGAIAQTTCGMRPSVDRLAGKHRRSIAPKMAKLQNPAADQAVRGVAATSKAKAERWRTHIRKILGQI